MIAQTRDDNIPEQKQVYTLEITSATGGATVNSAAKSAHILLVASDYPHGLFEFEYPPEITIQEDSAQVRKICFMEIVYEWETQRPRHSAVFYYQTVFPNPAIFLSFHFSFLAHQIY